MGQSMDIKTIATFVSLAIIFAGVAGTWTLLKYRVDTLEASHEKLEASTFEGQKATEKQGEEIKCLICQAHEIPCPGC